MTNSEKTQGRPLSFEQKLQNYADLAVQVGLGLGHSEAAKGQRVLVEAPVDNAELTRAVVRSAYKAGASYVDVRWDDDDVQKARFELAPEGSFETISKWRVDAETEFAAAGGGVLAIRSADPNLHAQTDPQKLSTFQRAWATYRKPYSQQVMTNALNWNLIMAPLPASAKLIFPDLTEEEAVKAYWEAIFKIVRADQSDPVAAWREHLDKLHARKKLLTDKQYTALHFKDTQGETDVTVGLADNHIWGGGTSFTPAGIEFTANIPTEEVWTAPHRERVDGVVVSTKPLSYNGVLIDGIRIRFEGGKVVEATAKTGQDVLQKLIETDEGSHHLGEVALVAHSSPVGQSGLFFYNTLYDENAACHIAIGAAYRFNVEGGTTMSDEDFKAHGGNDSLVHVDWMIGNGTMNVEGITKDGSREPIMRNGEFVI